MKASDLFIHILEQKGVKVIYGVPGEENLDLIDSLRKSGKIKLILTRNEQTAVFMAATYGRLTGEVGVAIATLGPGATNMVTGVAFAQLGGFPVMVITGQKPIKKSKQGQFQIIDVVSMMKPITKYATTIISGNKIPHILHNAFKIATSERPGAVAVELPEDIAGEFVENPELIISNEKVRRPIIDEKSILILKEELQKAKSPIILIGAGANRKRITKYLTEFIVKYNIPFFTSQMGKGVVSEDLKEYLGTAALTSGDYIHNAIKESDLILSVGYDPIEKPTHLILEGGTKNIHINFYESNIDTVYNPYIEIIGDIGNTFWQLCETDIDNSNWDFEKIFKIKQKNIKLLQENLENEDMGNNIIGPRQLVNDVRSILQKDDIVALDNGLYKIWFARNYITYFPNTLLLDNALATMGAGVASGMEAKRINPLKNVVVITGDGGLVMNLGDLETVVRLKLDLTIIVLNNGSYGMIKWKQTGANMPEWGLDFGNPDFVKLAESFGGIGYKVENKNDFKKTLQKANDEKGLKIIDLKFEYPNEIN
ncbi:MAG: acetolactate synthase large subunit [Candidatus Gracilibacteria bacterium]|nr:acetolactate synthase large subunit [Candidatus Gracilibacteria bacterium]MDD5769484.1 acetolactate synthase large subunit [Candidatus Gracilibacteria bacterium]